jgi:hypothetical protein
MDTEKLFQTIVAFIQADSLDGKQRIVEQHPELLTDEADQVVASLVESQTDPEARQAVENHRALLQQCRQHGIQIAFAELTGSTGPNIPPAIMTLINQADQAEEQYLRHGGGINALNQSVAAWQQVLNHPDLQNIPAEIMPAIFNYAGIVFSYRYNAAGQLEDLNQALSLTQQAVALTPEDSPDKPSLLNNLGNSLSYRYARTGSLTDLEEAQKNYQVACKRGAEVALEAGLVASRTWGNWALERESWAEAVEAYQYGRDAIDRLYETQLERADKEAWLREARGLHARLGYAMLRQSEIENRKSAIATLEHGRAFLLSEALERNRADLERLAELGHGELLTQYRAVVAQLAVLEAGQAKQALDSGTALDSGGTKQATQAKQALHSLRGELDQLIAQIRQVPGYEDFFRRPTFERDVLPAVQATGTPLVYIAVTPAGGVAVITDFGLPIADFRLDSDPDNLKSKIENRPSCSTVWLPDLTEKALRERIQGPMMTRNGVAIVGHT